MDRKGFSKLLSKHFYPLIRAEGFKGSGSTLRRIDGPLLHVFNIQGSSGADGFYVNLGAHLEFLGGPELSKTLEYQCAFRDRLDPRTSNSANLWHYGNSEADAYASIDELIEQWGRLGRSYFEKFRRYPDSFETLVRTTDTRSLHPNHALTYAKIARHLGILDLAETIVEEALPRVGENAKTLSASLRSLLEDVRGEI